LVSFREVRKRTENDAKDRGYYLNPDLDFLKIIFEGLKKNEDKYGYPFCPCRLTLGTFEQDNDIICPCDYRDVDVEEHGQCFCALYVKKDIYEGKIETRSIPERRPIKRISKTNRVSKGSIEVVNKVSFSSKKIRNLWYCRQCGYGCYREVPPVSCPVCKAKKEIFSKMTINPGLKN
jgi:ferredoxin-thioredoxin reductase catalytic subunit